MSTWIVRNERGAGLRVAVKDLIDLVGLPTTAGSRPVAETARPAEVDATCMAGLRAAEARGEAHVAGKVNLHELAYGISGINPWFGTPVNPLDPTRVPGGSSSGSAVAVASGEADIAYGSDTGGSVRIPAACCGIVGLKTTWGRIPLRGVWLLAPGLDTVGPMAADIAGATRGMALLEPGFQIAALAPLRIGRITLDADPVIDRAIDTALAAAGFEVTPARFDGLDRATAAAMTVLDGEAWSSNRALMQDSSEEIGPDVRARLTQAARVTPEALAAARREGVQWVGRLAPLWEEHDLLALPTLLGFPTTIERAADMMRIRGLTAPVNLAGIPALALPVPSGGHLPASLQLLGPHGSEDRLLAAGALIEAAVAR
jgi:amidase